MISKHMSKRFKFLSRYIRPYTIRFIILLFIIITTTTIVIFFPYLFGKLVDALFYNKDISSFFRIVIIYFIIYAINQCLHYGLEMTLAKLYIEFVFDIKKGIFKKVLSYKSKQLSSINTGDIMYRMNKDADEVLAFIKSDLFYGLAALLEFIMCIGITAFISPLLSLFSLALVIITFLVSNLFKKRLNIYMKSTKRGLLF